MKNEQAPEQFFLRYSFPCAHVLLEMGSIDEKKFEQLRQKTINNEIMGRGELMMLFPAAFRRIIEVAAGMKKDAWDIDVLKKYFLEEHNNYIDKKDGNYNNFGSSFRDFCKVYKGEVIFKEGDMLTVKYGERQRDVLSDLVPNAEIGDKVTIHQGFAVEKLDD